MAMTSTLYGDDKNRHDSFWWRFTKLGEYVSFRRSVDMQDATKTEDGLCVARLQTTGNKYLHLRVQPTNGDLECLTIPLAFVLGPSTSSTLFSPTSVAPTCLICSLGDFC